MCKAVYKYKGWDGSGWKGLGTKEKGENPDLLT